MYIIVCGGGMVGQNLAERLVREGFDTVLIERDEERCKDLYDTLGARIIQGDASRIDVLQDAGIEQADVLVVVTGSDKENLAICSVAKRFNVPRIVARANDPRYLPVYENLKIDNIVSVFSTAITHLEAAVRRPNIIGILDVGKRQEAELVAIKIPKNAKIAGQKIHDISFPADSVIAAIYRDDELIVPRGGTEICENDTVVALVKMEATKKLEELLTKAASSSRMQALKKRLEQ